MTLLPKVKLKSQTNFPSTVEGRFGIDVVKSNGNFYIDLDYSEFASLPVAPLNNVSLFYDPLEQSYVLAPAVAGNGDVSGPASAVADNIAVFNGVTGKIIKDGGTAIAALATTAFVQTLVQTSVALRGYLAGLTLSTGGSSATFSVAAGTAINSTNVDTLMLGSAISKTTSSWAVGAGNGALDTGAIAINSWYHVHLIKRPDTGVIDVLISLSATAPTLPASYTLFRRIGSMKTNASNQWTAFTQNGDEFLWNTTLSDANSVALSSVAAALTVSVPTGVVVWAKFTALVSTTATSYIFFYPLIRGTQVSNANPSNASLAGAATDQSAGDFTIQTSTAAQIGVVSVVGSAGTYYLGTHGWIDRRGKDA